ncbi:PREDICTED: tctex1 domain-containing protein 1 [Chrysochloris asiatica]|uniref:Tctex1 domain-containing protein 1 n=1 Tax=Chrysochloris asiatica TaxID=185453 RepID=A0A9B0WPL8_CHRAS|nr:PREDICTED: tctex1 domain-containing protein 1 [Chrysochloris asiatica]
MAHLQLAATRGRIWAQGDDSCQRRGDHLHLWGGSEDPAVAKSNRGGPRALFKEVTLETGTGASDRKPGEVGAAQSSSARSGRAECPEGVIMSDIAKDQVTHSLKKRGSASSLSSHEFRQKERPGRPKGSLSTVSYMDEPSKCDNNASRLAVQMENTYQLGPTKHFPVVAVNHILKDVLTNYLQEEEYEPELCRQMTKTISEVIKARVKDLMIPRYKLIVIIHIGQLNSQSIHIGSRCLWDSKTDTFSSYVFRNSSLFALANVYAVYFE